MSDTRATLVKHICERATIPEALRVLLAQLTDDLGFISTIHKVQGCTLELVIVSLLARPGIPVRENYHAIYVCLTRIHRGDDLRALANPHDLDWVERLRPPPELLAFADGYDEEGQPCPGPRLSRAPHGYCGAISTSRITG